MSENLEAMRDEVKAQIHPIDVELAELISQGHAHSARALSLGSQRSKLLRGLRALNNSIRDAAAYELLREMEEANGRR